MMILFMAYMMLGSARTASARIVNTSHSKYSYKELQSDLTAFKKKYNKKYFQLNVIGYSADNRKLYEVVIGNRDAKKHLLVIANLHAREYMTTQLCMRQIEYYMNSYQKKIAGKKVSSVLDKVCIHYIPSCNPDGTAISQYGFSAIRSSKLRKALKKMGGSTSTWKANARGVDLNRNWPSAFRKSGSPGSQGYHGSKAASEPETKALIAWVKGLQKSTKVVGLISYHSTGSILYGRCASQATSSVRKKTTKMASLAKALTGYSLMPTESLSSANSCSREYFLYYRKLPCITLEVGHGACPLSSGEFSSIWKKNKNLVLKEAMLFD